jgi:hypothetical protein
MKRGIPSNRFGIFIIFKKFCMSVAAKWVQADSSTVFKIKP